MEPLEGALYCYCSVCKVNFSSNWTLKRHNGTEKHRSNVEFLSVVETNKGEDKSVEIGVNEDGLGYSQIDDGLEDDSCRGHESESSSEEMEIDAGIVDLLMAEKESNEAASFHPFPSKLFALLYLLVHSPRPTGESNLSFVWLILREAGLTIPSIKQVKNFKLPGLCAPQLCLTPKGIPFYYLPVSTIIKQCLGVHTIASSIIRNSVVSHTTYTEIYHGRVWNNDKRFHSPMVTLHDGTHAFINDVVAFNHLTFGLTYGIVHNILQQESNPELLIDIEMLLSFQQFKLLVPSTEAYIPYDTWIVTQHCLQPLSSISGLALPPANVVRWDFCSQAFIRMMDASNFFRPHPLKIKATGRKVVMLPLLLFSDDLGGNKSKKWHKFECWYILLAGLPRHENAKPENIHFVSCSDKMDVVEMMEPLAQELTLLETDGIIVYDAFLEEEVLVVAPLLCVICDNPRASQLLNHLTGSARRYCRICMADREIDPLHVCDERSREKCLDQIHSILSQGTESEKAVLRTLYGVREIPNPLLHIPADLYKCIPIEVLHTLLLGPIKYFLKAVMPTLSKKEKDEILARISAFSFSGCKVKMYGNVCVHYKSFVGRDYKGWSQIALFILYPYLSEGMRHVLLCLTKVFYISYCCFFKPTLADDWKHICEEFILSVKEHMPSFLQKQKVHLLLHLVECMQDFGPCSAFSAERCEYFNSGVRLRNIFSNKQAPSRDIANYFSNLQSIRYIFQGGKFNKNDMCGKDLRMLYNHPNVQHFLNGIPAKTLLTSKAIYQPGAARKASSAGLVKFSTLQLVTIGVVSSTVEELSMMDTPFTVLYHDPIIPTAECQEHYAVVSQNRDLVHTGNYVQLCKPVYQFSYGELLATLSLGNGTTFCIVRGFEAVEVEPGIPLLSEFDCPYYTLTRTLFSTNSCNISAAVSMVHHCEEGKDGCHFLNADVCQHVERQETIQHKVTFQHDWTNTLYCLNLYCV